MTASNPSACERDENRPHGRTASAFAKMKSVALNTRADGCSMPVATPIGEMLEYRPQRCDQVTVHLVGNQFNRVGLQLPQYQCFHGRAAENAPRRRRESRMRTLGPVALIRPPIKSAACTGVRKSPWTLRCLSVA